MAITSKELEYVNNTINKIPMPGEEYSLKVMKEIEDCYKLYSKIYKNKEYNFIFSNGEEISFEILEKNLCHMLGINYKQIKDGFLFNDFRKDILKINNTDFTSYQLLELMLEYSEDIVKNDNDPLSRVKAINYYKSGIKCQIFKKLSDFDKFNFGAINYVGDDEDLNYQKHKTLYIPSNEAVCPYFMVGISNENNNNYNYKIYGEECDESLATNEQTDAKYYVKTLFAPKDPIKFFKDQEVIIPTQILISDINKLDKLIASPEEKINLLNMYKSIIATYNLQNRMNIYGDYEAMLTELSNSKKLIK